MTTLTTVEIAQLTARLLGEVGYKRSATKEAAEKRFLTVLAEKVGPAMAETYGKEILGAASYQAACDWMATAIDKTSTETADPEAIADAVDFMQKLAANGGTNEGMGKMMPTNETETPIDAAFRDYLATDERGETFMRDLFQRVFDAGAASAATKPARAPRERKPRAEGPTKREIAAGLLARPEGCTSKEILDATGWPAVSVPAIAKASGLTLRQEKDGRTTRYFGSAE